MKCYFCGYSKYLRFKCPAENSICKAYSKKGHYDNVCRSSNQTMSTGTSASFIASFSPSKFLSRAFIKVKL